MCCYMVCFSCLILFLYCVIAEATQDQETFVEFKDRAVQLLCGSGKLT